LSDTPPPPVPEKDARYKSSSDTPPPVPEKDARYKSSSSDTPPPVPAKGAKYDQDKPLPNPSKWNTFYDMVDPSKIGKLKK
jgi:hypothetical protein